MRTHSNDRQPVPNVDFPGSGREVDRDVIDLAHEYQRYTMPSDPNYYHRDPFPRYGSLQSIHDNRYKNALLAQIPAPADKQKIEAREQDFQDLRYLGNSAHRDIDGAVKIYNAAKTAGHGLAGVFAIPTFGLSLAASTANHAIQKALLKTALNDMSSRYPDRMRPHTVQQHAYEARLARDRSAQNIVRTYGEHGRNYIENTSRLTDDSAQRYIASFRNLGSTESTTKDILRNAGITAASVELELARIAETRLAGAGVSSGRAYYA